MLLSTCIIDLVNSTITIIVFNLTSQHTLKVTMLTKNQKYFETKLI